METEGEGYACAMLRGTTVLEGGVRKTECWKYFATFQATWLQFVVSITPEVVGRHVQGAQKGHDCHAAGQTVIIPNTDLRPVLVSSQPYLNIRVTSFELAIICPDSGID